MHSEHIIRIVFPVQQLLHESASVLRNTSIHMYLPCCYTVLWVYRSSVTTVTRICLLAWNYLSVSLFCKITGIMTLLSNVLLLTSDSLHYDRYKIRFHVPLLALLIPKLSMATYIK